MKYLKMLPLFCCLALNVAFASIDDRVLQTDSANIAVIIAQHDKIHEAAVQDGNFASVTQYVDELIRLMGTIDGRHYKKYSQQYKELIDIYDKYIAPVVDTVSLLSLKEFSQYRGVVLDLLQRFINTSLSNGLRIEDLIRQSHCFRLETKTEEPIARAYSSEITLLSSQGLGSLQILWGYVNAMKGAVQGYKFNLGVKSAPVKNTPYTDSQVRAYNDWIQLIATLASASSFTPTDILHIKSVICELFGQFVISQKIKDDVVTQIKDIERQLGSLLVNDAYLASDIGQSVRQLMCRSFELLYNIGFNANLQDFVKFNVLFVPKIASVKELLGNYFTTRSSKGLTFSKQFDYQLIISVCNEIEGGMKFSKILPPLKLPGAWINEPLQARLFEPQRKRQTQLTAYPDKSVTIAPTPRHALEIEAVDSIEIAPTPKPSLKFERGDLVEAAPRPAPKLDVSPAEVGPSEFCPVHKSRKPSERNPMHEPLVPMEDVEEDPGLRCNCNVA